MSENHCSYWSGIPQGRLKDYNRRHIGILVTAFNTGVYNLPVNWQKVDWRYGGGGTRFTVAHRELATFDFDHLTRLVIAAHDECVRVAIAPRAFNYLAISMWDRQSREGSMMERHPTIEQAVAKYRGVSPTPTNASGGGE